MTDEGKIIIRAGSPLGRGLTSNAATVEHDLSLMQTPAGSVDGTIIYPLEVHTQRLFVAEIMVVDNEAIVLGEGVVYARNLVQTECVIANSAQIGGAVIAAGHISVPSLSAISANLGSITAGSISVAGGGVTISNDGGMSGIYIGGNTMYSKVGGVKTLEWDGATGVITANEFLLTASATSKIRTAASGARVEMASTGIVVYNSANAAKTRMTNTGFDICNTNADGPTAVERISFVDGSDIAEGLIFYNHTTHKLRLRSQPEASATDYCVIGIGPDDIAIVNSAGGSITLNADTSITLYADTSITLSADGTVQITSDESNVGIWSQTGYVSLDAETYLEIKTGTATGRFGQSWTTWTPTVTASGAMTVSALVVTAANYMQIGKLIHFFINISFTLGGTASTQVFFTFPVTAAEAAQQTACYAYDTAAPYFGLQYAFSTTVAGVYKSAFGNWVLGAGRAIALEGWYRAA